MGAEQGFATLHLTCKGSQAPVIDTSGGRVQLHPLLTNRRAGGHPRLADCALRQSRPTVKSKFIFYYVPWCRCVQRCSGWLSRRCLTHRVKATPGPASRTAAGWAGARQTSLRARGTDRRSSSGIDCYSMTARVARSVFGSRGTPDFSPRGRTIGTANFTLLTANGDSIELAPEQLPRPTRLSPPFVAHNARLCVTSISNSYFKTSDRSLGSKGCAGQGGCSWLWPSCRPTDGNIKSRLVVKWGAPRQ